MGNRNRTSWTLAAMVAALLAMTMRAEAAGTADGAELSPASISLDQTATLRLRVADDAQPQPPQVDGLRFEPAGQTSEMTSVNGAVTHSSWVLFRVTAERAGTFTIPVGGDRLELTVIAGGAQPAASARPATARGPASIAGLAFFKATLPERRIYVGQAVPITFKAYFRAGSEVTLTGTPTLASPAFTMSRVSDPPRQTVETIAGQPYRVVSWTAVLSAAMPGPFSTSTSLPVTIRYREAAAPQPRSLFGVGLLDDDSFPMSPMMRSMLSRSMLSGDFGDPFGAVRERDLTLRTPEHPVEVLPLPAAGRPAGFSGAVGRFEIAASLAPATGTALEPMTLKVKVSGQGNFDRVLLKGLASTAAWKSYPATASAAPSAPGTRGERSFEQAVIPQRSGRLELPPISLSYFDPERAEYVTRATAPMTVEIAAAAAGSSSTASAAPDPDAQNGAAAQASRVDPSAPSWQWPSTGNAWANARSDFQRSLAFVAAAPRHPWFWALLAAPLCTLGGVFLAGRVRRSPPTAWARRRAARSRVSRHRAEARRAAAAGDSAGYFEAARRGVQAGLAERLSLAPEDVTAAEVERRLGEAGAPIAAALRIAESVRYAGVSPLPATLTQWRASMERALDQSSPTRA